MRVLLVDDSNDVRTLMKRIVTADNELTLVGEAVNGREAINLVDESDPDIVVMDVEMPEMNGIDATKAIKKRHPEVRVLACTASEDRSVARAMASAGASAYMEKSRAGALLVPLLKAMGRLERTIVLPDDV